MASALSKQWGRMELDSEGQDGARTDDGRGVF